MNWLLQIHATHAVAHAIGILALVCLAGMALGSVKVRDDALPQGPIAVFDRGG
jgi:hypothetical protein